MPLAGRLETELVLLPCAVPSALCWKSQPEPLQGFGDQKRTDAPPASTCPWQRCPKDAWWELFISRLCARVSVGLSGPSSNSRCGSGEKRALGAVQSVGPRWGLMSWLLVE